MTWQLAVVLVIVAASAAYLGWRVWRTWAGSKSGCGGGCSCPGKTSSQPADNAVPLIPSHQLTLRRPDPRRG
jgi:FeoB-associated Cys-rich membrane protein